MIRMTAIVVLVSVLLASGAVIADHDIAIPYYAPEGVPTIDGDLSDWAGVPWIPLDTAYGNNSPIYPPDMSDAAYAVQWSRVTNLLYVAVTVTDAEQHLEPSFVAWNGHDDIEIYVDAGNNDVDYTGLHGYAQQIFQGAYPGTDGWTYLGTGVPSADIVPEAAAAVNGDVLTYEMAIVPFSYYPGLGGVAEPEAIVTLAADMLIGLDVAAASIHTGGTALNMATNNNIISKWRRGYALQDWILGDDAGCSGVPGDADGDGDVDLDDFVILKRGFGKTCEDPDWDLYKCIDTNDDCRIDLDDFVILKLNFGTGV